MLSAPLEMNCCSAPKDIPSSSFIGVLGGVRAATWSGELFSSGCLASSESSIKWTSTERLKKALQKELLSQLFLHAKGKQKTLSELSVTNGEFCLPINLEYNWEYECTKPLSYMLSNYSYTKWARLVQFFRLELAATSNKCAWSPFSKSNTHEQNSECFQICLDTANKALYCKKKKLP